MSTIPFSPKQKPDESTLTDRQRKVLDAIRTHIDEQGFAPSFREIGNTAGLKSPSSVKHQLQVLEDKGFIRMNANKGRAIEVVAGSAPNAEKPSQASEEATSTSNVAEIYQFPPKPLPNHTMCRSLAVLPPVCQLPPNSMWTTSCVCRNG